MPGPLRDEQYTQELLNQLTEEAEQAIAEYLRITQEIKLITLQPKILQAKRISIEDATKMGIIGSEVEQRLADLVVKQTEQVQILMSLLRKVQQESELALKINIFLNSLNQ